MEPGEARHHLETLSTEQLQGYVKEYRKFLQPETDSAQVSVRELSRDFVIVQDILEKRQQRKG
jgi:hypothetical protein